MEQTRATITSVGHYLPDDRLTNHDLEKLVDTNDEWIRTRTGIIERRILKDPVKATSYMAANAANEALEFAGLIPDQIDVIIVATVTPDYIFPSTACLVQEAIGATNALAFDLSAACSGFIPSGTGIRLVSGITVYSANAPGISTQCSPSRQCF